MPLKLPHHARAAGAPPPARERRRAVSKLLALLCIGAFSLIAAATAAARNDAAAGLCAFHESTTVNGTVATSTFRVVQDGCTVSLVSIEHLANGTNAIVDSATARNLKASATRYTLAVNLKCGVNAETDLVLGEAVLYPPTGDLQALPFRVACPAAAVAPVPAAPAAPAAAPAAAAAPAVAPAPAVVAPVVAAPVVTPFPAIPVTTTTPTKKGQKPASAKKKHVEVLGAKKTKKNNVKPSAKKKETRWRPRREKVQEPPLHKVVGRRTCGPATMVVVVVVVVVVVLAPG